MTPLFAYGMSPFEDTLKRVSGKLELEQRSYNSCCRFLHLFYPYYQPMQLMTVCRREKWSKFRNLSSFTWIRTEMAPTSCSLRRKWPWFGHSESLEWNWEFFDSLLACAAPKRQCSHAKLHAALPFDLIGSSSICIRRTRICISPINVVPDSTEIVR